MRTYNVSCRLTEEEYKRLTYIQANNNHSSISAALKQCVQTTFRNLEGHIESENILYLQNILNETIQANYSSQTILIKIVSDYFKDKTLKEILTESRTRAENEYNKTITKINDEIEQLL